MNYIHQKFDINNRPVANRKAGDISPLSFVGQVALLVTKNCVPTPSWGFIPVPYDTFCLQKDTNLIEHMFYSDYF